MIHRIYHFLLLAVWLNDSGGQLVPGRRHRRLAAKQLDLDLEIFVEKDKNEATKETSEFWKRNLVSSTSFGSFGSYPLPLGLSKTGKAGSKGKGGKAGSKGKAGKAGSKGKGGKAVLAGALGSKTGSTKAPKSGKAGGSKGVHAGELGSKTGPSKAPMNGKAGSGKAGGGKGGKGSPVELDEPPRPLRADHKKTGKAGSSKV